MMQLTEEQRAGLIALAENIISYSNEQPGLRELARIALAALAAEPVGYIHNFLPPDQSGGIFAEENRHYGRAVYTAPPVAALRLPDEKSTDIAYAYYPLTKARHEGWNACLAEVKRLNATTPAEVKDA